MQIEPSKQYRTELDIHIQQFIFRMNASGKLPATAQGLAPDAESLIRFMRSTFPQSHRCKEIADKTHIESGTIHEILIDTLQPRGLVKIWTKSSLSSPATTPSKSLLSSSSSSISTPDSIIPIPIVEDQWVYVIQKEDIAASDPAALKFAASPAKPPPPNQESSAIAIDVSRGFTVFLSPLVLLHLEISFSQIHTLPLPASVWKSSLSRSKTSIGRC